MKVAALSEQIDTMRREVKIIFCDGDRLHLYGFEGWIWVLIA